MRHSKGAWDAEYLACEAHAGQVDKAGRPYIEHLERVASAMAGDDLAYSVAWLHDVLEDCRATYQYRVYRFPKEIYEAVFAITRKSDESPDDYYMRVASNPVALKVKLADIADNADESRLAMLDDETANRLRKKYAKAICKLNYYKEQQQ